MLRKTLFWLLLQGTLCHRAFPCSIPPVNIESSSEQLLLQGILSVGDWPSAKCCWGPSSSQENGDESFEDLSWVSGRFYSIWRTNGRYLPGTHSVTAVQAQGRHHQSQSSFLLGQDLLLPLHGAHNRFFLLSKLQTVCQLCSEKIDDYSSWGPATTP